jgi:hypothetical protein
LAYQPPASSTFLSEQTSHQQPTSSTFISEQTSTSHQPPAKRTGCKLQLAVRRQAQACRDAHGHHASALLLSSMKECNYGIRIDQICSSLTKYKVNSIYTYNFI